MADHGRRYHDDGAPREERERTSRNGDEIRSWFGDDDGRRPVAAATGTYRSDDRDYHERYRNERPPREEIRREREQRDDDNRWAGPGDTGWVEPARSPYRDQDSRRGNLYATGGARTGMPDGFSRSQGGGRGSGSNAGRGPRDYRRSDERIREDICDCMTDDPVLDASDITVQVSQGEVLLTGTVGDRDQKRRAEDLADQISGVRDVSNQLRLSRGATAHDGPGTPTSGLGTPARSTSGTTA